MTCAVVAGLAATSATEAASSSTEAPGLTPAELAHVRALGPWPPPHRPDPSNRVSGDARTIRLGRVLFSDSRMSPVGYIGCVTCHQPDRAFTDHRPRAHGLADLPRNTPALLDLAGRRWYGWGGASDSLWMASLRPIVDAREFGGSPASVVRLFERDAELDACYRRVFGTSPQADPTATLVNVAKALAAFQETLISGRTAFDDYRDALLRGDTAAQAAYPAAAARGLKLFVGRAGCVACHRGPRLTDDSFHAVAAPHAATGGRPDGGRAADLALLRASPYRRDGPHADGHTVPAQRSASGQARGADSGTARFRTPGLRNVAVTAPYGHDGRHETLAQALVHSTSTRQPAAIALTATDVADLAAFLATLTDAHGERRPWQPRGAHSTVDCD